MRFFLKFILVLAVIGGFTAAAYRPAQNYWKERNKLEFREAKVTRGEVVSVRNSTGTVKPVLSVSVGSFVSGPIIELNVDFNSEVKEGDVLAVVDPRLFKANVARDQAFLATRKADVVRAEAQLQQAVNDEKRAMALQSDNEDFISGSEIDQYHFSRLSLEAQVDVAKASVKQAEASLTNSEQNLDYTKIRSPVDGIVIDRKIEPGQTLASQFQTPELFIVAPDLRKEMHIFATVDEADIGLIREAKQVGQPVHFTVDAYPDDLFEGTIFQIRMSSTTVQNVVTYPVVVSAANPEMKLMPGMTASISFTIEEKKDVIKIPNAALRFYPKTEHVRKEDRKLLEGAVVDEQTEDDESNQSATEKADARKKRNRRHVWVKDGDLLKAIEVVTGISENKYTELVEGEIEDGRKLVTGIKPK